MEVVQMTKSPVFRTVACLVIVAFFVCGQQALAQEKPHFQIKVLPRTNADVTAAPQVTPAANLYALQAAFTQGYPTPLANSDGTDIWPCFGNSSTPNTDCPTIGNPSITFPTGGVALGGPAYVWQLANPGANGYGCDSNTNGTTSTSYLPCGQTETWYEDDSGTPNTFDLTYEIYATQVQSGKTVYLLDSGIVDFGPNPYGTLSPPADVIIYGDQNFGTWAGQPAKNGGNCTANDNYPVPSATQQFFIEAANKDCVEPQPGLVTIEAITTVATPIFTADSMAACKAAGVAYPCYKVTYSATGKHSITQKWTIFFE
jgi:hypothetical protein